MTTREFGSAKFEQRKEATDSRSTESPKIMMVRFLANSISGASPRARSSLIKSTGSQSDEIGCQRFPGPYVELTSKTPRCVYGLHLCDKGMSFHSKRTRSSENENSEGDSRPIQRVQTVRGSFSCNQKPCPLISSPSDEESENNERRLEDRFRLWAHRLLPPTRPLGVAPAHHR